MSTFERPLPNYRLAETRWGDDLQAVAARELGDANRWAELAWVNDLVRPYITTDPLLVSSQVLLAGAFIKVPAPVGVYTDDASRGQVYERDCAMANKQLQADDAGDIAVLSGSDNLRQQLAHRVNTPRGQARRNPEYGCLIWRLVGTVNGPLAGAMGAQHVEAALRADYRVASVPSARAQIIGDVIRITATARAIEGGVVDITYEST